MGRTDAKGGDVFVRAIAVIALAVGLSLAGPQAVAAEDPPDFVVSPQTPLAGQTVTFTATGIRPSDTVLWDFEGDGIANATGTTVRHVYPTPGERTVVMRVTNQGNRRQEVTKVIRVENAPAAPPSSPPGSEPGQPNQPPVASFTFFPRAPVVGDTVEFVSTSSDPETPIASHAWDLDGDGQFDDSSAVTTRRSFDRSGRYTVGLRVTDEKGEADVELITITVGDAGLTTSPGLSLMSPFPVVRIIGRSTTRGVRIRLLMVQGAPRGVKVTVRCRGRGCPPRRLSRVAPSGRLRARSFERRLGAGARIQIFVTQRGKIGKYTAFRIRRARRPLRRDLCVTSSRATPKLCPSS